MILTYKVKENDNYKTVEQVLKNNFEISNRLLIKLKKNNLIFLNNVNTYINAPIYKNDTIHVNINFIEESPNIVPTKMNLNIIYEDDYYIIINKEANIPVHPSLANYDNSLSNGVKYYFECNNIKRKIRPVNRLDKNTSGIVIFAKNEYIQECLIKQMKNNIFKKQYIALLEGKLNEISGTINAPIFRKENSIIERCVSNSGSKAITHYEVIKEYEDYTMVKFTLETGRTHQIRVHSRYINHPILRRFFIWNRK